MAKYVASCCITGYFECEVEADSEEAAVEKVVDCYNSADFGVLQEVEMQDICFDEVEADDTKK